MIINILIALVLIYIAVVFTFEIARSVVDLYQEVKRQYKEGKNDQGR